MSSSAATTSSHAAGVNVPAYRQQLLAIFRYMAVVIGGLYAERARLIAQQQGNTHCVPVLAALGPDGCRELERQLWDNYDLGADEVVEMLVDDVGDLLDAEKELALVEKKLAFWVRESKKLQEIFLHTTM